MLSVYNKFLIFSAGELARSRRARGLKLNHPEAVALITSEVLELGCLAGVRAAVDRLDE